MPSEDEDRSDGTENSLTSLAAGAGQSLLDPILDAMRGAGREGIITLLDSLMDALFSPEVRLRLEHEAEEGFTDLLESLADSLPDSAAGAKLQQEIFAARGELRRLLRTMLDTLFTGTVRSDFRTEIEAAADAMLRGDMAEGRQVAEHALQTLLESVLHAVQEHWGQVMRLALRLVAKALQEALFAQVQEGMKSIVSAPRETMQDKAETVRERMEEKADELRERLIEARDTMQERLEEARTKVQGRLGDRRPSGGSGGSGRTRLGTPPSLRPPGGPPGRAPNGRPPSGHPPSGPGGK